MKKTLLCAALLGGLSLAQAAGAQDFDDRWYITGSAGMNLQDNDRGTRDAPFVTLGMGKFITPEWSLDGELNYQNPQVDRNQDLNWSQYGISFDLRRHFIVEGRDWNPYVLMGVGVQRHEEEYAPQDVGSNSADAPFEREGENIAAKFGAGVQGDMGRVSMRAELAYRI